MEADLNVASFCMLFIIRDHWISDANNIFRLSIGIGNNSWRKWTNVFEWRYSISRRPELDSPREELWSPRFHWATCWTTGRPFLSADVCWGPDRGTLFAHRWTRRLTAHRKQSKKYTKHTQTYITARIFFKDGNSFFERGCSDSDEKSLYSAIFIFFNNEYLRYKFFSSVLHIIWPDVYKHYLSGFQLLKIRAQYMHR